MHLIIKKGLAATKLFSSRIGFKQGRSQFSNLGDMWDISLLWSYITNIQDLKRVVSAVVAWFYRLCFNIAIFIYFDQCKEYSFFPRKYFH